MKRNASFQFWTFAVIGLICLGAVSCIDKIDFEVPAGISESIAIQGVLEKGDPSVVNIFVSQIFDFTAESRQAIRVRDPKLVDEQGKEILLTEKKIGEYTAVIPKNSEFSIEYGKSYKISLATFDGRKYESSFEKLYEVAQPDELTADFIEVDVGDGNGGYKKQRQIQFYISTPLMGASGSPGISWGKQRTYKITDSPQNFNDLPKVCYITETIDLVERSIAETGEISGSRIDKFPLYSAAIDYRFAEGYYFTAIQYSLSEGALKYWKNVNELVNRTGNMFESPPGKLVSNISNPNDPKDEVYGYFYVTEAKVARVKVDSTMVGNLPRFCPPKVPSQSGDCPLAICCNCLAEKGSTTKIPSFWK